MKSLYLLLSLALVFACSSKKGEGQQEIRTPYWVPQESGTNAGFRGLSAVSDQVAWASGSAGTVIRTIDGGQTWEDVSVPETDTLQYRDIEAFDANTAIILSAGSPAKIFKTEDGGKTWTIRNGLKQTVTKHDKLRAMVTIPLTCPKCENAMKPTKLNKKMWPIHGKCFDCVVEYETKLKATGGYEEYAKKLMNTNKDSFVTDYEQAVEAYINDTGDTFMSEAGDLENWSKAKI